ncbi:MAG TPA: class I lanthipeptide [Thermoanaerobaculia bacterium]|jgi:hypothetical protein|nr:class I lanthipeptide [Thermoanaerobaculia bacterium]
MKPKNKRLRLSKETLHLLQDAELGEVAGGNNGLSQQSLCISCTCPTTSVRICCTTETA